jgi:hypothetical protein
MEDALDKFIKNNDRQKSEYGLVIKTNFKDDFILKDANTVKDLMSTNETEFTRWAFIMAMKYPETKVGQLMAKQIASTIIGKKEEGKKTNLFSSLEGLSLDQLKSIEAGELGIDDLVLDNDGVYKSKREIKEGKAFSNVVQQKEEIKAERPDVGRV